MRPLGDLLVDCAIAAFKSKRSAIHGASRRSIFRFPCPRSSIPFCNFLKADSVAGPPRRMAPLGSQTMATTGSKRWFSPKQSRPRF